MSEKLYISLYHGRNAPNKQLDDWGFEGPIIGPVAISWTYGGLKIHDPEYMDFENLPIHDDLVVIDEKYYGDFEILGEENDIVKNALQSEREVFSFDDFLNIIGRDRKFLFYKQSAANHLDKHFGLNLNDADITDMGLREAMNNGWHPGVFIEDFADKYDLTKISY